MFIVVAALVSQKFVKLFNQWQITLEKLGYRNYAQVLNAKNYGVPQNRERIFLVSIRNDVDMTYYFPQPFLLQKRIKDILETEVDERYYVKEDVVSSIVQSSSAQRRSLIHDDKKSGGIMRTLAARDYKEPHMIAEDVQKD